MDYQVPVDYTVNVSLAPTLAGLADYNTNAIALFTNEETSFSDNYQAYITPTAVAKDFGTNSLTNKMAQALFTPVPNFRTGNGVLYIFKTNAQNATSAKVTTAEITANIGNFQSLSNGSLNITIDGNENNITGLNFTSITSVNDIVTILNNANLDVYISSEDNKIIFTSKRFGTASSVTIGTSSTGTDISGANYLNIEDAQTTTGTNATGETLAEAVKNALQKVYFGGVLTTQYVEDELLITNATAIQSLDTVYFEAMTSLQNISVTGAEIKESGLSKTRNLAYSNDAEDAKIAIATYATISKSVNRSGSNTANTMNLKTLTGVKADNGLSDTYVLSANDNGVDIYGNTGGLNVVYSNDNNGYTDDIENNLWIKKAIEVAGFNYLRQTNSKIPQTESAMTGLKNAYANILEQAIRNGIIAPGTWNTPIPFGDPETFKENIEEKGYYIYSQPVALQAQTEREARKAPLVQIALKTSGAMHFGEIIINVER